MVMFIHDPCTYNGQHCLLYWLLYHSVLVCTRCLHAYCYNRDKMVLSKTDPICSVASSLFRSYFLADVKDTRSVAPLPHFDFRRRLALRYVPTLRSIQSMFLFSCLCQRSACHIKPFVLTVDPSRKSVYKNV